MQKRTDKRGRGWKRTFLSMGVLLVCAGTVSAQQREEAEREKRITQNVALLERGSEEEQGAALFQLAQLNLTPSQGVPLFRTHLQRRTNSLVEALAISHALEGLAKYGPAAKAALPELDRLLEEVGTEEGMRTNGGQTLWWLLTALSKIGPDDPDTISALKSALRRGIGASREMRTVAEGAAMALSQMGPQAHSAVPLLTLALDSSEADHAGIYATALSRMMPEAKLAVPHLARALQAGSSPEAVATALGDMGAGAKSALPSLTIVLHNPSPPLACTAFAAIAKIEGSQSLTKTDALTILKRVEGAPVGAIPVSLPETYEAFRTVKMAGKESEGAVPVLTAIVEKRTEPWLRRTAIETLAAIGPQGHHNAALLLIQSVTSHDPALTLPPRAALAAFGPGDANAAEPLGGLLLAGDTSLHELVATLLFGMAEKAAPAVPALAEALQPQNGVYADTYNRRYYLRILSRIGPAAQQAVPALTAMLLSPPQNPRASNSEATDTIRTSVLTTLMKIGMTARVMPAVREMLRSSQPTTVACAAHAVGLLGKAAADTVPLLLPVLRPSFMDSIMTADFFYGYVYETNARLEVIRALEAIGPDAKEALPLLHRFADQLALSERPGGKGGWAFPDVKQAALHAIAQIER